MKRSLTFLLLFIVQTSFAQLNVDSLWTIYHDEKETDSTRLLAMWTIAYDVYLFKKPDTSLILGQQMYEFAVEKNQELFQANALNTQGTASFYLGQLNQAIDYHLKALEIVERLEDHGAIATTNNNIALIYRDWGQLDNAIDYFQKSLKVFEKIGHKPSISTILGNIGAVYADLQDYENSKIYYKRALEVKKETNDKWGLALLLAGLGTRYLEENKIDSAMIYYRESLELRIQLNNINGVAQAYKHIGSVFIETQEIDSAMFYYDKSLALFEELNIPSGIADLCYNIAVAKKRSGDQKSAIKFAERALTTAAASGFLDAERDASHLLFELYKTNGDYKKALMMHERFINARDLMNKEENQKAIIQQQYQYDYDKKALEDQLKHEEEINIAQLKFDQKEEKQRLITISIFGGLILVSLFLIFVFNRLRVTKKQKLFIEKQKKEVDIAHLELGEKNQEIMDSITYAKRIQSAILPSEKAIQELLQDYFILYKPKDIVAGDFYWFETFTPDLTGDTLYEDNIVLFAAADCTGHGVPGAMVSVICNNGLNRSVREYGLTEPGKILDQTREIVIKEFEKSEEDVKDGMDIALCALTTHSHSESHSHTINYSGANNPLWIIRKDASEVEEVKADKQPIGKYDHTKPFTTHELQLFPGDTIYIFTDGFVDQFGGSDDSSRLNGGKKFKSGNFKKLLLSIQDKSMVEQKEIINDTLENWKGNLEQIDDVCVIGVRV